MELETNTELLQPRLWFQPGKLQSLSWNTESTLQPYSLLVGGTSDQTINRIFLWNYPTHSSNVSVEPSLIGTCVHRAGNVSSVQFVELSASALHILSSSSSNGSLTLYQTPSIPLFGAAAAGAAGNVLREEACWKISSSISTFSVCKAREEICTAGEDGAVHFIRFNETKSYKSLSLLSNVYDVHYVPQNQNELIAACSAAELQFFDLRTFSQSQALKDWNRTSVWYWNVSCHPTSPALFVTGGSDGGLTVWDRRKPSIPVRVSFAPKSASIQVVRHMEPAPDLIYSGGADGSVLLWNNVEAGDVQVRERAHLDGAINALAFNRANDTIAVSADNFSLCFLHMYIS